MSLLDAVAAPRASQRNSATNTTPAEAEFIADTDTIPGLQAIGHKFSQNAEIGAATGVERAKDGRWRAVAEPKRRGGGAARVVWVG
jgi:gamma-glutamyltranspeptidase/glutathione hydrolase